MNCFIFDMCDWLHILKERENFMCYCKDGNGNTSTSISTAGTKIPSVTSDIETSEKKNWMLTLLPTCY